MNTPRVFASSLVSLGLVLTLAGGCDPGEVSPSDARASDAGLDVRDARAPDSTIADTAQPDTAQPDTAQPDVVQPDATTMPDAAADVAVDVGTDTSAPDVTPDAGPSTLDLHEATIFDNPADLADWPVTTQITEVDFQYMGADGVHVEFSLRNGPGSWPDITPPGWTGPLEYTLGFAEYIDGHWYASAAIEFWRGLESSGGNVAEDVVSMGQCTAFGHASTCQVARNWYYDGRWGALSGYQPATGEIIGVFVVAGNLRGVTDGSQSPVRERSNVVLVRMPDISGARYVF